MNSSDIYIKHQWQIKIMARISLWFEDSYDALNWYLYQKLNQFGGLTAEELLIENGQQGYESLMQYVANKELCKLKACIGI